MNARPVQVSMQWLFRPEGVYLLAIAPAGAGVHLKAFGPFKMADEVLCSLQMPSMDNVMRALTQKLDVKYPPPLTVPNNAANTNESAPNA